MEPKTIYGDGETFVRVDDESVTLTDDDGAVTIVLSRAAFREVVIGWERLLDREGE